LEVDGRGGDLLLGGVVAVRQVSSVGQTETHDSVLRLDHRGKGGEAGIISRVAPRVRFRSSLGGRSRVRLDVDTPDLGVEVESLQGSVSAEVLEDVNVLPSQLLSRI
jgi:hypothetical protein